MPNIKSSKKDVIRTKIRTLRNKSAKSAIKTFAKKGRALVEAGDLAAAETKIRDAQALINKTASRGIIHKNQAARRTSRLMKKLAAAKNNG